MAELSMVVAAPAPYALIALDCTRVVDAERELYSACERLVVDADHWRRFGDVAEVAVLEAAPTRHRAARANAAARVASNLDVTPVGDHCVRGVNHRDRRCGREI